MSSTPHDALFKFVFSEPESARSLLSTLVPPGLATRIDWGSLRVEPGSFVDEALGDQHTDLLFSVQCDEREVFLYLLLEHQSSPHPLMPYRLYGYIGRIWEVFFKKHPTATLLPAVVPLVVHHGEQGWTAATDLREIIDLSPEALEAVEDYLPRLRFILDDLVRIDEDELQRRTLTALARAALLLFRNARTRRPEELRVDLVRWLGTFLEVYGAPNGVAAFRALMRYTLLVNKIATEQVQDFARRLGPAAVEAVVTTGEQLIAQGMAKGMAKGRAEGKAELVLKLLRLRFGALSDEAERRVWEAGLDELDAFAERVLTAVSLDEALGA